MIPTAPEQSVAYVVERFQDAQRFDRPFKELAVAGWRQSNSILRADWPYFSTLFDPQTQIAVSDTVEQNLSQIFPKDQFFDLEPVEEQDERQTELMRELMRFTLRDKIKYKILKYFQFLESVQFGNGVERHTVRRQVRKVKSSVPITLDAGDQIIVGQRQVINQVVEFWPETQIVSRFNCYPSRGGSTIQKMPYFCERRIIQLDTLKALAAVAGFQNVDQLDPTSFAIDNQQGVMSYAQQDERMFDLYERLRDIGLEVENNGSSIAGNHGVKYAELIYYWEKPDSDDGCGSFAIVGNGKFLLKSGLNPFGHGLKPYSSISFAPYMEELWQAEGLPSRLAQLQNKLNVRVNQLSDIIDLIRSPMKYVGANAGVADLSELREWPGASVRMNDINGVRELSRPGSTLDIDRDVEQTMAQIQRVSRRTDVGRGMLGDMSGLAGGANTAAGMSMMIQQQNNATTFQVLFAEETGIKEGLDMTAQNLQETITTPQVLKISQNDILKKYGIDASALIRPEDIAGKWNFFPVGASKSVETPQQATVLGNWIKEGRMDPELGPQIDVKTAWLEAGNMLGVRNTSRFLLSQEALQQKAMQEAQQSQQGQQSGPSESISFKDLPVDGKIQMAAQAGIRLDPRLMLQQQAQDQQQKAAEMQAKAQQRQPQPAGRAA